MAKHLFQKGNQFSRGKGRPKGSGGYRAALLQAVGREEFAALVSHLYRLAMAGDMQAAGVLVGRLVPPLRSKDEPVSVDLPDGTPLDQARAIVAAVAAGTLTPQEGKTLLDGLAAVVRIEEVTELTRRIEALEGTR